MASSVFDPVVKDYDPAGETANALVFDGVSISVMLGNAGDWFAVLICQICSSAGVCNA